MLTGDNWRTANAFGRQVGVDRILAEVLPQDKAHEVRKLQLESKRVGMVGDRINDAPALAQADVGFGTGTDVAIEAPDITLISGSLRGVVLAIEISRATMRNVYQNLFGAFIYSALGILVALGALYPFFGILHGGRKGRVHPRHRRGGARAAGPAPLPAGGDSGLLGNGHPAGLRQKCPAARRGDRAHRVRSPQAR
jgi:hypothetical protein